MRAALPLLLTALAGTSGCSLFGTDDVREARLTGVTVEALPLDRRWDGSLLGADPPDVYVDLKNLDVNGSFDFTQTVARTVVQDNTAPSDLPLALGMSPTNGSVSVDAPVRLTVNDRDAGGFDIDDVMFATDTLRLAEFVRDGDAPGDERTLTFESPESRIRVHVRWE